MTQSHPNEIRWGVLGAGDVCRVKSAPAMNLIEGSRLTAVMRRDAEKARQYARDFNVPKWFDNADELLDDPDVNAVYIATPPHVHAELTKKAALRGKPVYVEKPMARTYKECIEMIEICEQCSVSLFVAYYRRTLPNFLKVKELIENNTIGSPRAVTIELYKQGNPEQDAASGNWRVDPAKAGGGYFYDLASHQLDFLDYLLGPITEVQGFATNQARWYEAEDIVTGTFRFENGVHGSGSWCFTTCETSVRDRITIIGSRGEITFPTFDGHYVEWKTELSEHIRIDFEMPRHIQQPLIQTVVNALSGRGECPSTGRSAARTNLVMEQLTGTGSSK